MAGEELRLGLPKEELLRLLEEELRLGLLKEELLRLLEEELRLGLLKEELLRLLPELPDERLTDELWLPPPRLPPPLRCASAGVKLRARPIITRVANFEVFISFSFLYYCSRYFCCKSTI